MTSSVLYTEVDAQCDKLHPQLGCPCKYRSISAASAQFSASGRCLSTGQTDRRTNGHPTDTWTLLHLPLRATPFKFHNEVIMNATS